MSIQVYMYMYLVFTTVSNSMEGFHSKCVQVFVDVILALALKKCAMPVGLRKLAGHASLN